MEKIRSFSQQHTILCTIVFFFAYLLMSVAIGVLEGILPRSVTTSYFTEIIHMVVPVAILVLCGYGFSLRMKGFGKTLKAGIAYLVFYLLVLVAMVVSTGKNPETEWPETSVIMLGVLSLIGVGIREETFFRGLIGNTLVLKYGKTTKGLWIAVFFSSFLFAAVHILNILAGVQFSGMVAQVIGTFALGTLFTAIYLRGGNIWVPILIHAIVNSSGLFVSTFTLGGLSEAAEISNMSYRGALINMAIQFSLTLFLLRKSKRPAIFARLDKLREEFSL